MQMFNIGDKIVYPTQGVGIIDVIEEKDFNGKKEIYYKIHLVNNTMKVMLPLSRAEKANMRLISDPISLDSKLHNTLYGSDIEELSKIGYKQRNERYFSKSKLGKVEDYLDLISDLTHMKKKHNLNYMEKTILRTSKKILADEISQSKNLSIDEANNIINNFIYNL